MCHSAWRDLGVAGEFRLELGLADGLGDQPGIGADLIDDEPFDLFGGD